MVGTVAESEDLVQEAYLRLHQRDEEAVVESPRAFLTTVVTRLAIDHLRSARRRREAYVGPWLPEPLLDDAPGPAEHAEQRETLSLAFLVLLEQLTPAERAAFLLHDVFGYSHSEVAEMIDKSEDNARQLASRARRKVDAGRPRVPPSPEQHREITDRFMRAVDAGDVDGLVGLLAADAVSYSDGGGVVTAARKPVEGPDRIARFLTKVTAPDKRPEGVEIESARVNGLPGYVVRIGGMVVWVLSLEIDDGKVRRVRIVLNPEKLRHLAP
jgi:RNA polymerase sigma-70 factor (ECF subfamily)